MPYPKIISPLINASFSQIAVNAGVLVIEPHKTPSNADLDMPKSETPIPTTNRKLTKTINEPIAAAKISFRSIPFETVSTEIKPIADIKIAVPNFENKLILLVNSLFESKPFSFDAKIPIKTDTINTADISSEKPFILIPPKREPSTIAIKHNTLGLKITLSLSTLYPSKARR